MRRSKKAAMPKFGKLKKVVPGPRGRPKKPVGLMDALAGGGGGAPPSSPFKRGGKVKK
jgi:hypothetical protein